MPGQQDELGSDGLPVLVQGQWSQDKLYFLEYFSSLFNGGMKNKWQKRAFVDLFAGPGLCKDRNTESEFSGSPLRALECSTPFTHLFFNDKNEEFVDALKKRQHKGHPEANVKYFSLDCDDAAQEITKLIPNDALTLAFIDPWDYIQFDSIAHLARRNSMDLIVTFHTGAIKRNAHQEVAAVDALLDDPDWRHDFYESQTDASNSGTADLIEKFQSRLKQRLGYSHFGVPMAIRNSNQVPIFYLLFASRHQRGLDFWAKSAAKLRSGQRVLL